MGERTSRPHRYLEVQAWIQQDIHMLEPHSRLLSRVDMMKKYGVTRTTIEKAISELVGKGLIYNIIGSGTFVADRTVAAHTWRTWGVVLPNITDDFYPEIVRGIQDVAQENRCHIVLLNSDHKLPKQHQALEQFIESGVQGVIVVPAITKETAAHSFKKLQEQGIPFIFCNRTVEGVDAPKVVSNNFFGAYLATRYVIQQGCRRIAYIGGPMYSVLEQRYQGFLGAIHEAGITADPEWMGLTDEWDHLQIGFDFASKMFKRSNRPDAVVCFNDTVASGVYRAAADAGLLVGRDVAIVGYGDTKLCETLPVKLTSVRYPAYQTGYEAANMLVRAMSGEALPPQSSVILQSELVIRASCGESLPMK